MVSLTTGRGGRDLFATKIFFGAFEILDSELFEATVLARLGEDQSSVSATHSSHGV